jgi:hypothetical protein
LIRVEPNPLAHWGIEKGSELWYHGSEPYLS